MSEKQYRTLRKLFVLWLRIFIFKKHDVLKNLVLILSIVINGYFIYYYILPKNAIIPNDGFPVVSKYYDLQNLHSVGGGNEAVVYKNLKKIYENDLTLPDYARYTKTREIDPEWRRKCIRSLRKIIVLKLRVDDLEKSILALLPEYQERSENLFTEKKLSEDLSDMSNYYAKFISQDDYEAIISSIE